MKQKETMAIKMTTWYHHYQQSWRWWRLRNHVQDSSVLKLRREALASSFPRRLRNNWQFSKWALLAGQRRTTITQRQELGKEGPSTWTTGPASNLTGSGWNGQWGPRQAVSGRNRNTEEKDPQGVQRESHIRSRRQAVRGMCPLHRGWL